MKLNKLKAIIAAIVSVLYMSSCDDLRDSYEDCGVWLEFIFDHNMEYADTFGPQIGTVDVLVFDESGRLYSQHYSKVDDLNGGKRMFIGGTSMPAGKYSIVTIGGLTDHFEFSHSDGMEFVTGSTTLENVTYQLRHDGPIAHEFPHLWFGEPTEIEYKTDLSVWPVPLKRQTNKFNITLRRDITVPDTRADETEETPLFTFEIITPESGQYDYRNRPLVNEPLSHRPYSLRSTVKSLDNGGVSLLTGGNLNTMRLISDYEGDYILSIQNVQDGEELWSTDLIDLLAASKPALRADKTPLPLDEYFDREGNWNVVIVHNGTPDAGFLVTKIIVNDWVLWNTGMGA